MPQDSMYDFVQYERMQEQSGVSHNDCIENARRAYLRAAECSDPVHKAELNKIAELWGQLADHVRAETQTEIPMHAASHR
jgi:hypothetical protein